MCWNCSDLDHEPSNADDVAAVDRLQSGRATGAEIGLLRERLWVAGWNRVCGLIATQKLHTVRVRHRHRPFSAEEAERLAFDVDARQAIVAEAIAQIIDRFLDKLKLGDGWRAEGGASLT